MKMWTSNISKQKCDMGRYMLSCIDPMINKLQSNYYKENSLSIRNENGKKKYWKKIDKNSMKHESEAEK